MGGTCPEKRSILDKGRSKVLLMQDAPRLAKGQYAIEAVSELQQRLMLPSYSGNTIVILAGDIEGMNRLISRRGILSSLFQDEIIIHNLKPRDCLTLPDKELSRARVKAEFLKDSSEEISIKLAKLIEILSELPSWGNA